MVTLLKLSFSLNISTSSNISLNLKINSS